MIVSYSSPIFLIPFILALGVSAQDVFIREAEDSTLFKAVSAELPSSLLFSQNITFPLASRDVFSSSNLFSRLESRQAQCPAGYPTPCGGNRCCPGGYNCCPDGCCPTNSQCRPEFGNKCCPNTAETCGGKACADAGSVCCGTYVCRPGYKCSTQGGEVCCQEGWTQCGEFCCAPGSTCSSTPGLCQRLTLTETSVQVTRTLTSTPAFISTATSTRVTATASSCATSFDKRQNTFGPNCPTECTESGEKLPVLNFYLKQGQTDALYESMCQGMFKRNGNQNADSEILNWGGSKDPLYSSRRKAAGCKGFCAEVNKFLPRISRVECDEYPPASTKQGGAGSNRKCITWNQNSGYQGPQIRKFASKSGCNLQDDDRFIIRMKDGCSNLGLTKRQAMTNSSDNGAGQQTSGSQMTLTGFNDTILTSPEDNGASKWISVQLDDLRAGQYGIAVPLGVQIEELVVLDGEGMEYASISSPSGMAMLNFTLEDDIDDGASLVAFTNRQMNISFTAHGNLFAAPTNAGSRPLLAPFGLIGYAFLFVGLINVGI